MSGLGEFRLLLAAGILAACLAAVADAGGQLSPGAEALWARCAAELELPAGQPVRERYIGDAPQTRELLLKLILKGEKTITSTSPWLYENGLAVKPVEGEMSVLLDSAGQAQAVLRTTQVKTLPWQDVTEEDSQYEGKPVRPIAAWRDLHWDYMSRKLGLLGRSPSEDMPITLERFEVVCRNE